MKKTRRHSKTPRRAQHTRRGSTFSHVVLQWAAILACTFTLFPLHADTHIYAGAVSTNQNGKLSFSNGALFDATKTNFALPQVLRTNGLNAGHFRGDALTFSVLPATEINGGPVAGHAAFGSLLAIQIATVKGPPGGTFAFWEGDGESDLGAITFSVPVGETNGSNHFVISQNFGQPATDPYGHIHGRQLTTSLPGIYLIGFQLIDLSTNGAGGGPIHTPSDILELRFQAGARIETLQLFTNRVTASFRSPPGISNLLERADSISSINWQPAAAPIRGNNFLQTFTDTNAPATNVFYRLRQINNLP